MVQRTNSIFLGCNYSNKKVKGHFEKLKSKWEAEYPLRVILIDRVPGKGARDLWGEIKQELQESSLAILDLTGFKPNVVLELGYALAVKDEKQIVITHDERKNGQKTSSWQLSDIPHLTRVPYKTLTYLDQKLNEHLPNVYAVQCWTDFKEAAAETGSPEKYCGAGLKVLHELRAGRRVTDQRIRTLARGTAIRANRLGQLLKDSDLARRRKGRNGAWELVDEE
jgi:hypothetical protein